MKPSELRVNRKIIIKADPSEKGYAMVIQSIRDGKVFCKMRHSGPIGGDASPFDFYVDGDGFKDGTGLRLLVEPFTQRMLGGD